MTPYPLDYIVIIYFKNLMLIYRIILLLPIFISYIGLGINLTRLPALYSDD